MPGSFTEGGTGPLEGIKVLDFTQYQVCTPSPPPTTTPPTLHPARPAQNGPGATRRLCDYGASVVKVELINQGDPFRNINPLKDHYDLNYETYNRGKRSVAIDLRKPETRAVMQRLVEWCDVLVENFVSANEPRTGCLPCCHVHVLTAGRFAARQTAAQRYEQGI